MDPSENFGFLARMASFTKEAISLGIGIPTGTPMVLLVVNPLRPNISPRILPPSIYQIGAIAADLKKKTSQRSAYFPALLPI